MVEPWMIGPLDLSVYQSLMGIDLRLGVPTQWLGVLVALLGIALAWATFTDLFRGRRIPNLIPYIGLPFGLLALPLIVENPWQHVICGTGIGLLFFVFALIGQMGMGDVKLAATLGLLFGGAGIAMVIITYLVAGAAIIPWIASRKLRGQSVRKTRVPMAPFFFVAYLAVLPAIGVEERTTTALVALGLAAVALGWLEQRLRPLPTLEAIAAAFLASDGAALRVVPGSEPQVKVDEAYLPLDALPKVKRGWLEHLLLGRLLSYEQEMLLLRTGETGAEITLDDEQKVQITVRELRNGSVMFEAAK